jgi:sugar phosphate permease
MAKRAAFYGWTLVGVLFLTDLLLMGLPYYSVINTYMLKQIHMSRSLYGLGFTLVNLFYGLPSTLVAAVILKWGLRTTFATGAALLLCGTLWLAFFVHQPWEYLVSFGVLIGSGFAFTTNVPISSAITRWFKRYRGRAMAIALSGAGVGGFVGAPMVDRFLRSYQGDWQQAWKVMACLVFMAGLVAVFFVKERPEDLGQVPDGSSGEQLERSPAKSNPRITNSSWTASQAYRSSSFWLVVIGAFACKFPLFFMLSHWILHLRGAGVSAAAAAAALGIFTITQIPGQLVGGWLVDKIPARYALMLGFCCYLSGAWLAIPVDAGAIVRANIAAALFGLGFGWTFIAAYTSVGHFYGPGPYPKLTGMLALISSTIAAPSGAIAGGLFDLYGNYRPALELIGVVSLTGMVAAAFAKMPRMRKVTEGKPATVSAEFHL